MKQRGSPLRFLRTTAIGGLLFLLPLIVVGALIGQVVPIVLTIAESLGGILPGVVKTPGGISLLILLAIVVLLLLCFGAGILARKSFGRSLSEAFEKKLLLLFLFLYFLFFQSFLLLLGALAHLIHHLAEIRRSAAAAGAAAREDSA